MSSSTNPDSDDYSTESTKKNLPRPSNDFYSHFECPICFEYFVPPIVRCPNDHNFCLTCVQRSALSSSGLRCSLCRKLIDVENINRNLQEQMSMLFISCKWEGCGKQVILSRRSMHQSCCKYSDDLTSCYYNSPQLENCKWKGTPTELVTHLYVKHGINTVSREDAVRYLWDIPNKFNERFRPRVFEISYPSNGKATTFFILEHYYSPDSKMLLFLIRSVDSDIKVKYVFSLNSKKDPDYSTEFIRKTLSFKGPKLTEFPNCNIEGFVCIPYRMLKEIKHKSEGIKYFSFTITFVIKMDD